MKRKLAVIGAGSAGLLSVAHLCTWLDESWEIFAIHNPKKKILGIGESTNGAFVSLLERSTNFSLASSEDMAELDATIKYGSKFKNWRKHDWVNPLLSGNIAIHFNNRKFKDFVYGRLAKLWPKQFRLIEGDVKEVQNYADHARVTTDVGVYDFDYVIDCMGTPPAFDGYTMSDCTLVDRCRIHMVEGYEYEPFTDHIATRDGWMFGVPLKGYKTYGYLYSSAHTETRAAEDEMRRLLGAPKLEAGNYDEHYSFRCYYANELISGRICKNGNKALFFEPLLANSMFLYIYALRLIYDHIVINKDPGHCNARFVKGVQEMEDVISYYYQGGSTFQSGFWQAASAEAAARLDRRPVFAEFMQSLRDFKQRGMLHSGPSYAFSPHTWQIVESQMGYGYLDPAPAA
ncbi:MAG TPA: tryptophan 7-halogenase [Polyangiaceae bacterium]